MDGTLENMEKKATLWLISTRAKSITHSCDGNVYAR